MRLSISLWIIAGLAPGAFACTLATISESAMRGALLRRIHRHADSIAACWAMESAIM